MSVKASYLISINALFLLSSYDVDPDANWNGKDLPLIRNLHVVFGTDQILIRNGTVINYVEVVLKITDNGAAVKKDILYT